MTLSFTQTIDGLPNLFLDKIWASLEEIIAHGDYDYVPDNLSTWDYYRQKHIEQFGSPWEEGFLPEPKIHTIRGNRHSRWRAGMDIHFVINNRQPTRFQFAPVIKCVSVQEIQILNCNHLPMNLSKNETGYLETVNIKGVDFHNYWKVWVGNSVDGRFLSLGQIYEVAINDGFNSVEDFFKYFNKDFTGVLIHWTDKRY